MAGGHFTGAKGKRKKKLVCVQLKNPRKLVSSDVQVFSRLKLEISFTNQQMLVLLKRNSVHHSFYKFF
jgi:hypothetical protein